MTGDSRWFVPQGASRFWPFVTGTVYPGSPTWKTQVLLCSSILEGVLRIQPTEPRENWRTLHRDVLANLMHHEGAGKEHPSRAFVASLIRAGDSVLDVGCG